MENEEDPFDVLEQMLANKGKRRSPGKKFVGKIIVPKKTDVVDGSDGELEHRLSGDEGGGEESVENVVVSDNSDAKEKIPAIALKRGSTAVIPKPTAVSFGVITRAEDANAIISGAQASPPADKNKKPAKKAKKL